MTTFVLVHGAGDSGWSWHLVVDELQRRGHVGVAPDLPADAATLADYLEAVLSAVATSDAPTDDVVVVGHSFGGFTAPLVAARLGARQLVLVAAMVPRPGESCEDWWDATGYEAAARRQAELDGGLTGNSDEMVVFYNGVPAELAHEAARRGHEQAVGPTTQPWPLSGWPEIPTRFVLPTDDRFFPATFLREVVAERLGVTPEEMRGGHCVMLADPSGLVDVLLVD